MPDAAASPLPGAWHPVGLSTGFEPGTANGTRLFGAEIVVWRDAEGIAHVWEDRCPHRGMRLSLGFVRGSEIACLYHGWRYDASGRCRAIPAHPQLTPPDTIRVPVLETAERLGMIWARHRGDDGALPTDRIVTPVRSIAIDCAPAHAAAHLAGLAPAGNDPADAPSTPVVLRSGGHDVLVGLQPLAAAECVLHVVIAGDHGAAARRDASRWAEALRATLEDTAAEGMRP